MRDKPLDVYVLFDATSEQRFIKIADDGCLAIFEDEVSATLAKRRNPDTDYKQVSYYSQKQVDQMLAENEALIDELVEALEAACEQLPIGSLALQLAVAALSAHRKGDE